MKRSSPSGRKETESLRAQVKELTGTLDAIASGQVDAIVVTREGKKQIYTLKGADYPYRALIENIREGALTLSPDGMILYCNAAFAGLRGKPIGDIPGTFFREHIAPKDQERFDQELRTAATTPARAMLLLCSGDRAVPVQISMTPLALEGGTKISMVVADRRRDYDRLMLQGRMLDEIGDAVIATDPEGAITFWNETAAATFGWGPGEAKGQRLTDLIFPGIGGREAKKLIHRFREGKIWEGESAARHRDGRTLPIFSRVVPIFDDMGGLMAIIGAASDISAKKASEAQLRADLFALTRMHELSGRLPASTGFGSFLQEAMDAAVAIMGADKGTLQLLVNDSLQIAAHTGHEEPFLQFFSVAENTPSACGAALKRGETVVVEDVTASPLFAGTPSLPVFEAAGVRSVVSMPLKMPGGEILGILTTQWAVPHVPGEHDLWRLDLLARQAGGQIAHARYEETLRKSEERYRELAEKAGSIILRFDPEGRITYINEFAERFFGFARAEVIGRSAVGTILPATESTGRNLAAMVEGIIQNPVRYAINENENIKKNGDRVWIQWTNRAVYNPDGSIRGLTTIGNDITDRKKAEIALQEKHDELNAAFEELEAQKLRLSETLAEKEVLLSEIHHRVKNNLTAFISLLSLEGAYDKTPSGIAMKNDLQNRARSMALIHETLYRTQNFSRVDMNMYLSTLTAQTIGSYKSRQPVRATVDAKGVSLDIIRATPAGLIVNELLTNAVKYAWPAEFDCEKVRGAPPTIGIRLASQDGAYTLSVKDNGVGLPATIDPATTKTLGLKLVTFLARHQLRAETEIDRENGTGFIFRLHDAEDRRGR